MRYIDHGNGGPPSVMKLAEGPKPSLKPGEVLIEVAYAGVNRPDVLQRSGAIRRRPGRHRCSGWRSPAGSSRWQRT